MLVFINKYKKSRDVSEKRLTIINSTYNGSSRTIWIL